MSRIWKLPITLPDWVEVSIKDNTVKVKWPKGELSYSYPEYVKVSENEWIINVEVESSDYNNLWWLVRSLINNMVVWVKDWFTKKLEIIWVWYNAKIEWKSIVLNLWYSHPIKYDIPEWIQASVDKDSKWNILLTISWVDKQLVWQVAANIRFLRLPEPYKGKWVRYQWETVKIKVWKTAKK